MDAVKSFNAELSSLYEVKPPISKAKMTALTRGAIKGIKFYKHVVQSVEKFILKCKPEYKVPGLYVIDSIVRQSRHQFGADKDVFAPRFAKNMQQTFMNLFKCPAEDKSKIIRVLNLWQKNQVFAPEVVQPLFDLADPNHPIHKEIQSAAAHQAQLAAAAAQQQQQSNGAQQVVAQVAQAVLLAGKGSPAIQKTPTKTQQMQQAAQDQASNNTHQTSSMDANTLAQLQQLHRLLLRQQQGDSKQDGSGGNAAGNAPTNVGNVHFDKKLLDFDYGSDEDDDGVHGPSPKVGGMQGTQQGSGMDVGNLLANPEVLRQLSTLQQSLTQPSMHEDLEKMRKLQQMKQQEDEFDKHLAQTVPNLPFAAECEFKPIYTDNNIGQHNLNSFYMPSNDLMQMNQPPSGLNLNQQQLLHQQIQQQMDDSMNDNEVEFVGTGDTIIEVIDQDSPLPQPPQSPTARNRSPSNDNKHSSLSSSARNRRNRSRSRDRPSPSRRNSRRGGGRSRTRSPRSRSRDRSPRRGRHGRSRSKERGSGGGDKGNKDRVIISEMDREREKERSKRGLPPIKKENLSVCSTTLWVGHLSKLVHQEDISDTFGEFGEIVTIDMILPRGCAFVVMNRRQDASRCLTKLKGFKIQQKAITLAWAPGKGVKGKELKDYWEGDLGVSYIPWSKLKHDIDIDLIEDGGMIDEETAPIWLKPKLDRSASHVAAMNLMKPDTDMAIMPPPFLGQPSNMTGVGGGVLDTSQPPPGPPAGALLPPPGQPMQSMPQLVVSPFQLNNRLMGMNLPPGLMPNVNIGVPPPNLQNALMTTNQLLSLNAAANINAAVAAAVQQQQQQQQPPHTSVTAALMSQLGALGEVSKPPPNAMVNPTIPPPSSIIATMAHQHHHQQPSLSETLLSLAQQQPPPQPFNLMHHPPPIQDSMDVEMEDVHDGGIRGNGGGGGQSLSDQLLSMQNHPASQLIHPPPSTSSFQPPPLIADNNPIGANPFTSALSRLHAVTNHRNDNQQLQQQHQSYNNRDKDRDSPSRNNRDRDNNSNRDGRNNNNQRNNRGNNNKGGNVDRGRDRDRDNSKDNSNSRESGRRGGGSNRDRDSRDINRDRDRNRGGGGYGNRDGRDSRDEGSNRRDRDKRSNDRGGDRDAAPKGGERNNRWGPTPEPATVQANSSSGPLDDKEKERKQREKALNDRLREMAGMEKQEDKTDKDLREQNRALDRDDRDPRDREGSIKPLFPDGPPGQPPKQLDQPIPTTSEPPATPDGRPSASSSDRRDSTNSKVERSEGRGGGGRGRCDNYSSTLGADQPFRRSSSRDNGGGEFEHGPRRRSRDRSISGGGGGPPSLMDVQSGPPGDLPPPLLDVVGPPPDFPPPIMNIPPDFDHPDMMGMGGPLPPMSIGIFEPPLGRNVSEFDGPPLMMRGDGREERFPPPRDRFRGEDRGGHGRGPGSGGVPTPLLDFMDDGGPFNHHHHHSRNNDNFLGGHPGGDGDHHHNRDFGPPIDMFNPDEMDMGGGPPGQGSGGVFEPPGGFGGGGGGFNSDFGPPPGFGGGGDFGMSPSTEFGLGFGPPHDMNFGPLPPEEFDGGGFRGGRGRFRGGRGGHGMPPHRGPPRGPPWMDNDGGGPPPPAHNRNNNFGRPPNNFGRNDGPGPGRFKNDFMEFDGPPGDDQHVMMLYENETPQKMLHGGGGMHDGGGGWRDNRRGASGRGCGGAGRGGRDGSRGGGRGGRGGGSFNNNQQERSKNWRGGSNDNLKNRDSNDSSSSKPSQKPNRHEDAGDIIPPPRRSGTPLRDEPPVHTPNTNPAPPGVLELNDGNISSSDQKGAQEVLVVEKTDSTKAETKEDT